MSIADPWAPLPFSLRQLQYALAVAELRSFRGAAERCRVAQPSLSAQLAALEDALGLALFERTPRRVLPTGAAAELLERARRVLLEATDLLAAARNARDPLTGTLRLGVLPTIAPYWLPHAMRRLRAAFPRLRVVWVEEKTAVLADAVRTGSLDAAVVALEAPLGELEREALFRDAFVLAVPRRHRLARGRAPVRLDTLDGERVLLLDDGHCLREQVLAVCEAHGAHERGELRATSLPTLVQMVAQGDGVTLLPSLAIETEARRAPLVLRPLLDTEAARTVGLVWRPRSALGEALRRFARVLREAPPRGRRDPSRTAS
ncbi:MAG: LysR substrate-binding domain-containing protein [Myxococcota bacterium]|nr:LysR substrate-binding domain-containing protein [Myxococcota bacterium]MDW8363748.1 LysR substrate-binding domain-containing protein [Myxococcales bacterium]